MSASILLTGATGYIGGRLLRRFEEGGRAVRCLVREPARLRATKSETQIAQGDCLDEASLDRALAGVHSAYYLVHSMGGGSDFAEVDRRAADNFGRAAARAGVRRLIYLGGLTGNAPSLSTHLKSRAETGDILRASGVPVVEFRASIVIGAGSLSFEMIQALVERLPVMICPRWVATPTQPIAVDDVLAYLVAALDLPHDGGSPIFEIGGPEVVSYGDMMREYARLRGLRRWLVPVPLLTPHLSGLWLRLVTPAQARIGRALVEGLRNPTVVRSTAAPDTFPIEPMPLRQALINAIRARASGGDRPVGLELFTHRSVVHGRAEDVFQWHERPEALKDLTPLGRLIRIESQTGGVRDGGRVRLSFGIGPLRVFSEARHFDYVRGEQFSDEQVKGPFKIWRHTHRIKPLGAEVSLYEDRIEYALPGGPMVNRLARPIIRRLLAWFFSRRHQIVRESFNPASATLARV
jgi:uncharacterized protein YbjT (DUF2867 family)/ligand-binding SRPBCC domain-containing protein